MIYATQSQAASIWRVGSFSIQRSRDGTTMWIMLCIPHKQGRARALVGMSRTDSSPKELGEWCHTRTLLYMCRLVGMKLEE